MPFIAAGHVKKGNPATNRLTYIVGVPAHEVGGRMYIAIVSGAGGSTFTAPAGWSTVYNNVNIGGAAVCSLFSKIATSSEPATVDVSTSVKDKAVWICWTVTEDDGVNATGTNQSGTSATATIAALTPLVNDSLAIGIVATDQQATPFGEAANWTKLDEHTFGGAASIAVYYRQRPLIHSGGEAVSVGLGASKPWVGLVFAITPTVIVSEPIPLIATMIGASATPSAALGVERPTSGAMAADSASPDVGLLVERVIAEAFNVDSATPDVVLHNADSFRLVATLSAVSDTPSAGLLVERRLPVTLTAESGGSATLTAVRYFAATLTAQSNTSSAFLSMGLVVVRGGISVLAPSAVVVAAAPSIAVLEN